MVRWSRRPARDGGGQTSTTLSPLVGHGAQPGRVRTVASDLPGQIEPPSCGFGLQKVVVDQLSRHQPAHLELDSVWVLGVQSLGGAVIRGTYERSHGAQTPPELIKL